MKHVHVSCAIIEKDGLILAAQRSETMSLPLKWEFPGGKLEPYETPAACLEREIQEELGIGITIRDSLSPTDWLYPSFAITLYPFICSPVDGEIMLAEHKEVRWVSPDEFTELDWADADLPVLRDYLRYLEKRSAA